MRTFIQNFVKIRYIEVCYTMIQNMTNRETDTHTLLKFSIDYIPCALFWFSPFVWFRAIFGTFLQVYACFYP